MICLRTSRGTDSRVRSGEVVGKPVGTPDGVQWMRGPEWSVDPLNVLALALGRIYGYWGVFWSPTKPPLKPLSPSLAFLSPFLPHLRNGFSADLGFLRSVCC